MREPFVDYMKRELMPDTVLIACGLPATYKTETTEVIAEIKGYFSRIFSSVSDYNELKQEAFFLKVCREMRVKPL